ncbi:MAG: trigger factor, partial [Mesorhizobium sp.]
FEQVRRYPGNQQQEVFEFYRNNPEALNTLRAPMFEEKVVDHLLGQISVTDVKVSKEELMADDEEDETSVKAKPAKKAAAKKADAKKADDAEEPKKKVAPKKKAAE